MAPSIHDCLLDVESLYVSCVWHTFKAPNQSSNTQWTALLGLQKWPIKCILIVSEPFFPSILTYKLTISFLEDVRALCLRGWCGLLQWWTAFSSIHFRFGRSMIKVLISSQNLFQCLPTRQNRCHHPQTQQILLLNTSQQWSALLQFYIISFRPLHNKRRYSDRTQKYQWLSNLSVHFGKYALPTWAWPDRNNWPAIHKVLSWALDGP